MSRPLVSVLIDTYNHESFIEQAIESVLVQGISSPDCEILVVDDGSADHTADKVRQFAPRVRLLQKPNGGQASAFNAGIPETSGQFVAFLDGDDWWAAGKLGAVLEAFEKNPETGVVGHGFYEEDSSSGRQTAILPERTTLIELRSRQGAVRFSQLKCLLGTSRLAIRRTLFSKVLPVPESLRIEADEFMNTVATAAGGAVILDKPLTHYRLHPGNLFHFQAPDPAKLRVKCGVLADLVRELSTRLRTLAIPEDVITTLIEPTDLDVRRLRLALEGGAPWETFQVERAAYRLAYRDVTPGYRIFKGAALALTSLLPPRLYYRLRAWYAERGLSSVRRVLGEPTPAAPIVERRIGA